MKTPLGTRLRSAARRSGRARGFTLIEMLVVIAVIAILAAFLGVAVQGARMRAQVASTSALLNRISGALTTYNTRYNAYPPAGPAPGPLPSFGLAAPAAWAGGGAVPPVPAPGTAYDRSAVLHFYLGALLYTYEGFRGAGAAPTLKTLNDPLAAWKKSDLEGLDIAGNQKVTQFEPTTPAATAYAGANIVGTPRRIVDAWGHPIGYAGPQFPASPPAAENNLMARDHRGWVLKQYAAGPVVMTSNSDNRRSFDLWSVGPDGRGGPPSTLAENALMQTIAPTERTTPTDTPPGSTGQLSIWDDLNNWFNNR